MPMERFIDLCILCGCDYTTNITGVGPIKAFKYIEESGNIERVVSRIQRENENPYKHKKYHIPENFKFKEARELFKNPTVNKNYKEVESMIKWNKPDEDGLKEFLIQKKGFSEAKVESGIKKLKGC